MNFKRMYIWFALPLILFVIWFSLVFIPLNSGIKSRESDLARITSDTQSLEKAMKELLNRSSDQKRLHESYEQFMAQTPTVDRMPEYMKSLTGLARMRGVLVETISARYDTIDPSQNSQIFNPVFEMGLKGDFLDMGRFLEDMSRKGAYKNVQAARIDYSDKEYPQLSGNFAIEFKALKDVLSESK